MFSQLCKARLKPYRDKFSTHSPTHRVVSVCNESQERTSNSEASIEDNRCLLEHCTFCEYRLCCEVTSQDSEESTSCNLNLKVTENPAYGLSTQNLFETENPELKDNDSSTFNNVKLKSNFPQKDDKLKKEISAFTVNSTSPSDCDVRVENINMNHFGISIRNADIKLPKIDMPREKIKSENQKACDIKHNGVSWSVLKHRQACAETIEKCNKSILNVADSSEIEIFSRKNSNPEVFVPSSKNKINKDKHFPLSLIKPMVKTSDKKIELQQQSNRSVRTEISKQRHLEKISRDGSQIQTTAVDHSKKVSKVIDPLSEIAQIKTEESIQEWLARISESGNNFCTEDSKDKTSRGSAWDLRNYEAKEIMFQHQCFKNETENDASSRAVDQVSERHNGEQRPRVLEPIHSVPELQLEAKTDTTTVLCNASKVAPANMPMVVMQCSRLHPHIGSKSSLQQTSLPMGTLVTALYQESEWMYVQTPHGVEGFISASNCVPIGTINNPTICRRPWEPCDFPIQISRQKREEFVRQQGAYIQTKLPVNRNNEAVTCINTIKMKTNFYNDRYFSNTFKSKDSIKMAKTVTDILRNSPETKVSH